MRRDYANEKPVNDQIFQVYRSFYSYESAELKSTVEAIDDTATHWRREKVSFNAGYGGERVLAHLFLPKNADRPYQTIIYFPGAVALDLRSSDELDLPLFDFLLRSGRAVLYPVYKGMYERQANASRRDLVIHWSKDFRRAIDYLEGRSDINRDKLAFYGFSLGGIYQPVLTAMDERVKASVQLGGGLLEVATPAEADPFHFSPRAKEPILMIVGRYDSVRPLEACQLPMYRLLGAPAKDKRLAVLDYAHRTYPSQAVTKEILDWLDHYLGPVRN
jgi:cephalosporin-C deacetylase-like acetyl esterase